MAEMSGTDIAAALGRIEEHLAELDRRFDLLMARDLQWGLIHATQQLEARQILAYQLGVEPGWLPVMRGWAASPDFLLQVLRVIKARQPLTVVECGSGVSTLILAKLLSDRAGGHIVSLDQNEPFAQQTAGMLADRGLSDQVAVTIAATPIMQHRIGGESYGWYMLDGIDLPERIDLLLVDGPIVTNDNPLARYPALPLLHDRLSPSATILLDDANRAPEQAVLKRWHQEFPDWRIEMLPTEKGTAILQRG